MSTVGDLFKNPAVLVGLATPLVGLAASQAEKALDRMQEGRERAVGFKNMLSMHPELRSHKDPTLVSNVYSSISKANPYLASDPFVAGAMVKNVVAGHEHITPAESSRMLLGEVDRAVQHRGALSRGGAPSQWGQMAREGMTGLRDSLKEHTSKTDALAKKTMEFDEFKNQMVTRETSRGMEERTKQLINAEQAFRRATGVSFDQRSQLPSARTRQWLEQAATQAVGRGATRRP